MSEEASINVPAIAAAHVTKRYMAQATDELTFEVTAVTQVDCLLDFLPLQILHPSYYLQFELSCDQTFTLFLIQVGDIVSVIDMPPKEDTGWWRGKHGFQVKYLL